VWCGILGNRIIGPVFFDGNLTGQAYLRFLQEDVGPLLEDIPLEIRRNMWLQHDGAPAHYSRSVREWLQQRFPRRWIGRGDRHTPVPWPARSPDLTPMDFFLWGYIKELVYRTPSQSVDDLKRRIVSACQSITPAMLQAVHESTMKRAEMCDKVNGQHFEHLL